ncbi:MAG: hypothetical protein DRJ40_00115 [Thermoprotei archaeon]|nr:MAG: hypothetical protein DRJ40_00115 [Thermoprotei archaeon]
MCSHTLEVRTVDDLFAAIPRGSLILIKGASGTGKTTLAAQFIYHGALRGEVGLYVSTYERRDEFLEHMASMGMNFKELERKNLFYYIHVPIPREVKCLEEVFAAILEKLGEYRASRLVIDSVTALTAGVPEREARAALQVFTVYGLKPLGTTTIFISEVPGLGFEQYLADVVLELSTEYWEDRVRRFLKVQKFRGRVVEKVRYEFTLGSRGIELLTTHAFRGVYSGTSLRVSTGVPKLDEVLGGGVYRGSVTLLLGPSGVGKSLLALHFLIHGARAGENVLYIDFGESTEDLWSYVRTTYGIDVPSIEERFRVVAVDTYRYTPRELVKYLSEVIDHTKPLRIALDNAQHVLITYDNEGYSTLVQIIKLLRSVGATSFITLLWDIETGLSLPLLALVDNVIAMWLDFSNQRVRRMISVVKAKKSRHETGAYEIKVVDGKLIIE